MRVSKTPDVDPEVCTSDIIRIIDGLSPREQEIYQYITDEWTVAQQIKKQVPHLNMNSICNNLMRLHKRGLIERTFPMNILFEDVLRENVRLWRRKT